MANRKTHVGGGIAFGMTFAGYKARNLQPWEFLVEIAGGGLGGALGGIMPDIFEPPINSWHRSTAHSCAMGAAGSMALVKIATV